MKKKLNVTIDECIKADFLEIAQKLGIKSSPWVEQQMREFIKKNKKLLKKEVKHEQV